MRGPCTLVAAASLLQRILAAATLAIGVLAAASPRAALAQDDGPEGNLLKNAIFTRVFGKPTIPHILKLVDTRPVAGSNAAQPTRNYSSSMPNAAAPLRAVERDGCDGSPSQSGYRHAQRVCTLHHCARRVSPEHFKHNRARRRGIWCACDWRRDF